MKIINELIDDQYEYSYIDHERMIARAVVLNESNEIALIHVKCEDIFGKRDYYELPGGGVKPKEAVRDAVIREIEEEIGYTSYILGEIGLVKDYYNLLHRCNLNHYFLLKTINKTIQHLEEFEIGAFEEIIWVSIDKAIEMMNAQSNVKISKLVKERELPILRLAKEMVKTSLQS